MLADLAGLPQSHFVFGFLCSPSLDKGASADRKYFGPSGFFPTALGFFACLLVRI
jgi:hypothetical protein